MTKWWVDPNFDPLEDLQTVMRYAEVSRQNTKSLVQALNDQHEQIVVLTRQNQQLLAMIENINHRLNLVTKEISESDVDK